MRGVFAVIVLMAVCFGLWLVFFGTPMNMAAKRVAPPAVRAGTEEILEPSEDGAAPPAPGTQSMPENTPAAEQSKSELSAG